MLNLIVQIYKSNQKWNKGKSWCECKNSIEHRVCKNDYVWDPSTCASEINLYLKNYAYLKSHIDYSVITCDEIIDAEAQLNDETPETVPINSNDKKHIKWIIITLL